MIDFITFFYCYASDRPPAAPTRLPQVVDCCVNACLLFFGPRGVFRKSKTPPRVAAWQK